ncbi:hypothetical protein SCUP515_11892 [Seiridium cupressi]
MFLAAVAVATTVVVALTGAFAAGFYLAWHYAWAAGHAEGCLKTANPQSQPLQVEGGRREEAEQGGKPAKGKENDWSCSDHTGFRVGGHVPQLMRNCIIGFCRGLFDGSPVIEIDQRLPRPGLNSGELTSKFRSNTTRHSTSTNNMVLAAMNPFSLSAKAFCTITTPASTIAAAAAAAVPAAVPAAPAAPVPTPPPPTGLGDRQAAWVGGWVRWGVLGPINGFKRGLFG